MQLINGQYVSYFKTYDLQDEIFHHYNDKFMYSIPIQLNFHKNLPVRNIFVIHTPAKILCLIYGLTRSLKMCYQACTLYVQPLQFARRQTTLFLHRWLHTSVFTLYSVHYIFCWVLKNITGNKKICKTTGENTTVYTVQ